MDKKKLLAIISGVLCMVMFFGLCGNIQPVQVEATTSAEIKEELNKLEDRNAEIEAELKGLRDQLSDNRDELSALVEQKDLVDKEIALLSEQKENINGQILACSELIADKQDELDQAQKNLEELQKKNALRIRAMEENGELSYWAVLAEANSIMEMLDCLEMVADVEKADKKCMEDMQAAADVVAEAKEALTGEQEILQEKSNSLNATEAQLEAKRAETDGLLIEIKAKGDEFKTMIEESESLQEELLLEIAQKKEDYEDAKNQEQAQYPTPGPILGGGTNNVGGVTWMMPCTYSAFTSPFGYRYHPISGVWKMHYGVDLAGRSGTPILATRAGYVTTAAYQAGGAGYYVSLNHGDGYGSIYMHMTHFIVSYGQYVEQGQVIGYMGTTGGSTGVHLHFGISYNGTYVNPADYINIV